MKYVWEMTDKELESAWESHMRTDAEDGLTEKQAESLRAIEKEQTRRLKAEIADVQ